MNAIFFIKFQFGKLSCMFLNKMKIIFSNGFVENRKILKNLFPNFF